VGTIYKMPMTGAKIQKNNNKVFELRFILYLCAMI
jgi:hypothetical protein